MAYAYAEGVGEIPRELQLLGYADRFGVEAVYGRMPGAGELRAMVLAENVVTAYHSRQKSENWAKWAQENPDMNRLLIMAVQNGE